MASSPWLGRTEIFRLQAGSGMKDCAGRCCAICLRDICSAPLWGSHIVLNSLSPPPVPVKAPDLFPASQSPLLCMFIGTLVAGRRVTPIIQDELISRSLTWLHQQGPFLQRGSQVPGVRSGHVLLGIAMPPTNPVAQVPLATGIASRWAHQNKTRSFGPGKDAASPRECE